MSIAIRPCARGISCLNGLHHYIGNGGRYHNAAYERIEQTGRRCSFRPQHRLYLIEPLLVRTELRIRNVRDVGNESPSERLWRFRSTHNGKREGEARVGITVLELTEHRGGEHG